MIGVLGDLVDRLLDHVAAAPVPLVALGVILIMTMDTTLALGLLVPSSDAVVATLAAAVGVHGAPAVVGGTVVGCLAGWTVSYLLGRRFGPALRDGHLGRIVGTHRWDAAGRAVYGRSGRALLVLQFLPVANAVIPAVAGALGMPYGRFARLATAGIVIWAVVFTGIGALAGTVVQPATVAVLTVAATAVAAVAALVRRSVSAGRQAATS